MAEHATLQAAGIGASGDVAAATRTFEPGRTSLVAAAAIAEPASAAYLTARPARRTGGDRLSGRDDVADQLLSEPEPLLLLGGDELTISMPEIFEELGLLPSIVETLTDPSVANARVAVARTATGGAEGHTTAMKAGEAGQNQIKTRLEASANELRRLARKYPERADEANTVANRMMGIYVVVGADIAFLDRGGNTVNVEAIDAEARKLISRIQTGTR